MLRNGIGNFLGKKVDVFQIVLINCSVILLIRVTCSPEIATKCEIPYFKKKSQSACVKRVRSPMHKAGISPTLRYNIECFKILFRIF